MKKLNNYLLLHHPQLWNLRIHWILPVIAILHLLFYISGYLSFHMGARLHYSYHINQHFIDGGVAFSVLVSVLLILLWLVFYLRNNPFKSFYPVGRWYFITEFTIIMLIFVSSITFFESYALGFWQSIRDKTATVDIARETNTLNIAYGLIPTDISHYNIHSSCDSIDFRDSLRALRRRVWDAQHPDTAHVGHRRNSNNVDDENDETAAFYDDALPSDNPDTTAPKPDTTANRLNSDAIDYNIRMFDYRAKNDQKYSYLNFCYQYYLQDTNKAILSKYEIAQRISAMLTGQDRKAVTAALLAFEGMCVRYEISKDLDIMSYSTRIFRDSSFQLYPSDFVDNRSTSYDGDKGHIYIEDITQSLGTIRQARTQKVDYDFWLAIGYLAFGFSLLLMSYRLSARRPWFIALVGSGVLLIIFFLSTMTMHGTGLAVELLFLFFLFLVLHIVLRRAVRRTLSGVTLVWWTWSLPFMGLLITEVVKSTYSMDPVTHSMPARYYWIASHYVHLLLGYLIGVFLYAITLLAAMYRRWQAMPEE